jgi:hypothetical protein
MIFQTDKNIRFAIWLNGYVKLKKEKEKNMYHSSLSLLNLAVYFFNWSIMLLCQEVYAYSGLQNRYPLSRFLFPRPIIQLHSGERPGSMLCR